MKIVYTKHAQRKFKFLRKLGWKFQKSQIEKAVKKPKHSFQGKKQGTTLVLKEFDENHDFVVVYGKSGGIITVVTFYPVKKGRYEKV